MGKYFKSCQIYIYSCGKSVINPFSANSAYGCPQWLFSFKPDILDMHLVELQYSPKIMCMQEVAQEVLVPQEHTSGERKLNCA